MTMTDVYAKYFIPMHLRRHLVRVAAVGSWIASHSKSQVDVNEIACTLLFHDMGNLLKFDLQRGADLFDPGERDMSYWQNIQNKMKDLYGTDEHKATHIIAREVGVSDRVLYLLSNMGSSNLHKTLNVDDWALKIVSYADFRVSPSGFVTVHERFDDIQKRYGGSAHVLADRQKTTIKRGLCLELEKQIGTMTSVGLQNIPLGELEKCMINLELFEIIV